MRYFVIVYLFTYMKKLIILMILLGIIPNINAKEIYTVNSERLNCRTEPNASSVSIGYLIYGTNIEVIDSTNSNWYKVKTNNGVGYVRSNYLTKINKSEHNIGIAEHNNKVLLIAGLAITLIICLFYLFTNNKNQVVVNLPPDPLQHKIVIKRKSVGIAILLSLLFGPFGMFYSTIKGAICMLLLPIVGVALFIFVGEQNIDVLLIAMFIWLLFFASFYWIICVVWAAVAANNSNKIIYQS